MSEETTQFDAHEEAKAKAKLLNWVDKPDYKGNPEHWRDAEEFLDFGERLNPILRENNKRLEEQLRASNAQIATIQEEVKRFAKLHEETEKVAYAKALAALKAQKVTALETGDYQAVVDVDEQIQATKDAAKLADKPVVKQVTQTPEIPAAVKKAYEDWGEKNQWAMEGSTKYNKEMDDYARRVGEYLVKVDGVKSDGDHFKPFLDKVEQKVREHFPDKFENPNRSDASRAEGGGEGGGGSKSHSYAALPKEAKETCDHLVKTKILTKEQYLASYKW